MADPAPTLHHATLTTDQRIERATYELAPDRSREDLQGAWLRELGPLLGKSVTAWRVGLMLTLDAQPWGAGRWKLAGIDYDTIGERLGVHRSTVSDALSKLRATGLVQQSNRVRGVWLLYETPADTLRGEPDDGQTNLDFDDGAPPHGGARLPENSERAAAPGRAASPPTLGAPPHGGAPLPEEPERAAAPGRAGSTHSKERAGAVRLDRQSDDDVCLSSEGYSSEADAIDELLDAARMNGRAHRAQVHSTPGVTLAAVAWCWREVQRRDCKPQQRPGLLHRMIVDGDWREPLAEQADREDRAAANLAAQRQQAAADEAQRQRDAAHRRHARDQLTGLTADQRDALHAQVLERAPGVSRKSWASGDWQARWPLAIAMHDAAVARGWCDPFDCRDAEVSPSEDRL